MKAAGATVWRTGLSLVAGLLVLLLTGCSSSLGLPEEEAAATIRPGDPIPEPRGAPVLVVEGAIGMTNRQEQLVLDAAALDRFGLTRLEVTDPWLKERVVYSGVLLEDLLRYAGADPAATEVVVRSLDDYEARIPLETIESYAILVATRTNGERMSIAEGGPTRLIYPYDRYPALARARSDSVWNIRSISVE